MEKNKLDAIAKEAASAYLNKGTDPNTAIEKLSEKHDLRQGHIQRVAQYTNEKINDALMDKEAYVEFPIARPDKINTKTASRRNGNFVPKTNQEHKKEAAVSADKIRGAYNSSGLRQVHQKILQSDAKKSPGAMIDHQNAAMKFEDATGISVDDSITNQGRTPDEILDYLVGRYGGQNKQASKEVVRSGTGLFSKLASQYGGNYVPSDDPVRDGKSMIKAASVAMENAIDQLRKHATDLSEKKKELYKEIKQSRFEGKSMKEIVDALKSQGHSEDLINYLVDKMEAEGLKETSEYDDDGPYSMQRAHRKAATMSEDSPLNKAASEVERLRKEATLDANCARICASVISNAPDLSNAHGKDREKIQKEAAGMASVVGKGFDMLSGLGRAAGKGVEKIEDMGKGIGGWIKEKPLLRSIELGAGGAAAGAFSGRQEEDWEKPKTQMA